MDVLSYKTLEKQGFSGFLQKVAPEKVLQFGEGNFLRAFVDYWFDLMNEKGGFNGKVVVATPIAPPPGFDVVRLMNEQDGLYTLYLRGRQDGRKVSEKRVVSSLSRCISPQTDFQTFLDCAKNPDLRFLTSNTTEAGIAYDAGVKFDDRPPASYPGKMCRFLYERWIGKLPGFIILACELIDHNGEELKNIVLRHCDDWKLPPDFKSWVEKENLFCSTLVDRIVPGFPKTEAAALNAENGYIDNLMDTGEIFGVWVIEGPQSIMDELPIERSGLGNHILVVDDHTPYKERKVRILNGAHTAFVPSAWLSGFNIVRDCMEDEVVRDFMNKAIYEEIIPSVTDLPEAELKEFAASVVDRFQNPFIDHQLLSICMNSTSKWKVRILPSLLRYAELKRALPPCLTLSFAGYLAFYRNGILRDGAMTGKRANGDVYTIADEAWVLDFFHTHRDDDNKALVHAVCGNERMWGMNLGTIPGFEAAVTEFLREIDNKGIYQVMRSLL